MQVKQTGKIEDSMPPSFSHALPLQMCLLSRQGAELEPAEKMWPIQARQTFRDTGLGSIKVNRKLKEKVNPGSSREEARENITSVQERRTHLYLRSHASRKERPQPVCSASHAEEAIVMSCSHIPIWHIGSFYCTEPASRVIIHSVCPGLILNRVSFVLGFQNPRF